VRRQSHDSRMLCPIARTKSLRSRLPSIYWLHNRNICVDDGQQTPAESRQIRDLMVSISPPSTSDPDWTSSDRQHYSASGIASPRPRGHLDADVTMKAHVTATVRACFWALRQIRSVRRSLPRHARRPTVCIAAISKSVMFRVGSGWWPNAAHFRSITHSNSS